MALIEVADLNDKCFLSLNTDTTKYAMVIKIAQEDLQDVLGKEFYDEIVAQYDADTLTDDNEALYDPYILDYLCWNTYYHWLKFANSDSTPTGEREFIDENSTILSDVKMYSKEKNIFNMVVRYKNRMLNFLKTAQANDSSKYSLYTAKCKDEMSFAISAVGKSPSESIIRVNKSITTNE